MNGLRFYNRLAAILLSFQIGESPPSPPQWEPVEVQSEVLPCDLGSQGSQGYLAPSPLLPEPSNLSPLGLQPSQPSKEDNNLLCYEEMSYHDDSDEDAAATEVQTIPVSSGPSHPQWSIMVVPDIDAHSHGQQYCMPSSNTVLFSPTTPWLTTASPQIATFNTFSPPMQALPTQTLQHFSPPVPIPNTYSPGPGYISGSPPFLPIFEGQFQTGEYAACNIQQ